MLAVRRKTATPSSSITYRQRLAVKNSNNLSSGTSVAPLPLPAAPPEALPPLLVRFAPVQVLPRCDVPPTATSLGSHVSPTRTSTSSPQSAPSSFPSCVSSCEDSNRQRVSVGAVCRKHAGCDGHDAQASLPRYSRLTGVCRVSCPLSASFAGYACCPDPLLWQLTLLLVTLVVPIPCHWHLGVVCRLPSCRHLHPPSCQRARFFGAQRGQAYEVSCATGARPASNRLIAFPRCSDWCMWSSVPAKSSKPQTHDIPALGLDELQFALHAVSASRQCSEACLICKQRLMRCHLV